MLLEIWLSGSERILSTVDLIRRYEKTVLDPGVNIQIALT